MHLRLSFNSLLTRQHRDWLWTFSVGIMKTISSGKKRGNMGTNSLFVLTWRICIISELVPGSPHGHQNFRRDGEDPWRKWIQWVIVRSVIVVGWSCTNSGRTRHHRSCYRTPGAPILLVLAKENSNIEDSVVSHYTVTMFQSSQIFIQQNQNFSLCYWMEAISNWSSKYLK